MPSPSSSLPFPLNITPPPPPLSSAKHHLFLHYPPPGISAFCSLQMDEWKRISQIPAFGNWDLANDLPITQYFESARQAGLLRHTSSSGETHPHPSADRDLYALDFKNHLLPVPSSLPKMRSSNVKENVNIKRQGKVWDVREAPRKANGKSDGLPPPPPRRPKPVDQDLYQIPPELLRTSKRSKMRGFISRCLLLSGCIS